MKLSEDDRTLIKVTLEHWDRMIEWAETQPQDKKPNSTEMVWRIRQCWYGQDCPLCKKYGGHIDDECPQCPISKKFGFCDGSEIENKWKEVARSKTWGEWLLNAKKFREQIASLLLFP